MQSIIWEKNLKTGESENYLSAPLMRRSHPHQDTIKIHPHSTLLMIGDSITDCGRIRPAVEIVSDSLGDGYVKLIHDQITATCPKKQIRMINRGIAGNTVRHLAARWQSDVLDLQPDWLSILIGINDVWPKFDICQPDEWFVGIDEYASTLERLIRTTSPRLKGIALMTPYCIESNRADPMRAMMDRYGDVVRQLAGQYQTILVDTQAEFDCFLTEFHPMALSLDRVHLKPAGHMILAQAFLKALGIPGEPGIAPPSIC